jgi:hypothetical protein
LAKRTRRTAPTSPGEAGGAYEVFWTFVGKKGSEIWLKYTTKDFSKPQRRTDTRNLGEYFSTEAKDIQRKATSEDKYLIELLLRSGEIDSSLRSLRSVPLYLKSFPKSRTLTKAGITESRYIIYHVENYIQEIYILTQKMERFLKFISRRLRRTGRVQQGENIEKCLQFFKDELKGLTTIRGRHVHQTRYLDEDLYTLTLFEVVRQSHKALELGYKLFISRTRSKMLNWIGEKNEELVSMLDAVFEVVNSYVLEP